MRTSMPIGPNSVPKNACSFEPLVSFTADDLVQSDVWSDPDPSYLARTRTPPVRILIYAAAMSDYSVKPLDTETFDAFARLVEKHNGVWGGCWCLAFHPKYPERGQSIEGNRALKQRLVSEGQAHAALVFDGDDAVGWCQYGSPEELPTIYHRKEYEAGVAEHPNYRLTCFFVDRDHRRSGVSAVALRGALDLIASAGGGVVEGYPQDTQGTKVSASFLYNGTRSLFEQAGFKYERPKGKNHCVMSITVKAS